MMRTTCPYVTRIVNNVFKINGIIAQTNNHTENQIQCDQLTNSISFDNLTSLKLKTTEMLLNDFIGKTLLLKNQFSSSKV